MKIKKIFCTLFDSMYMAKGMALIESLIEKCNPETIFVLALDDKVTPTLLARFGSAPQIIHNSLDELMQDHHLAYAYKNRSKI